MTTIAYDGRYFVTDSQQTAGSVNLGNIKKVYTKAKDGDLIVAAIAGDGDKIKSICKRQLFDIWNDSIVEEINVIFEPPEKGRIGFWVMAIDPTDLKVVWQLTHGEKTAVEIQAPYALGSGELFAMGAMGCGVDAMDAIRVAAKFNIYTNDILQIFDCKTKRFVQDLSKGHV